MEIIDEEGRLFGRVNVIDALVVVVVLTLVFSGIALVVSSSGPSDPGAASNSTPTPSGGPSADQGSASKGGTQYAAVVVRDIPRFVGQAVGEGDAITSSTPAGFGRQVMDVYVIHAGPDTVSLRLVAAVSNGSARIGQTAILRTPEYRLSGTLTELRDRRSRVEVEHEQVTTELTLSNVRPAVADDFEEGMAIRRNGGEVARVTAVAVEPAAVAVRSDDGRIFRRDHPINETVTLTVDLTARRTADGLRYNDRPLRVGNGLSLYFDTTVAEGTVTGIERG